MRELFCLRGRKKLKPKRCPEPVNLDILSHHPINFAGLPSGPALDPDDAVIPELRRIRPILNAAERAGHLQPRGRQPLWVTELWWLTEPHVNGVPPVRQARFIAEAFYRLWKQRVEALVWFELADNSGFPSGLFFKDGTPKLGLTAYRFPFLADRKRNGRTTVWGIPPVPGELEIQRRRKKGKGWRTIESRQVRGDGGAFTVKVRVPKGTPLRARIGDQSSSRWRAR